MTWKRCLIIGAGALLLLAAGQAAEAQQTRPTRPIGPPAVNPAPPPVVRPGMPTPPGTTPAAPAQTGPSGKVEFKEQDLVYDAGKVDRGTVVSHVFQLKNVGPGDLSITARPG